LERLFIPKAGSQEIDLSPLIKLKNLKCLIIDSGNKADLSPLASLTGMLYISHKGIKITDISAIQKMDSLIGFNADTQSADLTPLKGKTKLRELNLDYTELNTDLSAEADLSPLAELVSLERLFLLHFRAKDFSPIMRLKKLTYVEMSYPANANVTAADCQALFKANPELKGSCTAWSPQEERYVTSRGAK
jgi:hypothetical protein